MADTAQPNGPADKQLMVDVPTGEQNGGVLVSPQGDRLLLVNDEYHELEVWNLPKLMKCADDEQGDEREDGQEDDPGIDARDDGQMLLAHTEARCTVGPVWSPDGAFVAFGNGKKLCMWEVGKQYDADKLGYTVLGVTPNELNCVAWAGRIIRFGAGQHEYEYDTASGQHVCSLDGQPTPLCDLHASANAICEHPSLGMKVTVLVKHLVVTRNNGTTFTVGLRRARVTFHPTKLLAYVLATEVGNSRISRRVYEVSADMSEGDQPKECFADYAAAPENRPFNVECMSPMNEAGIVVLAAMNADGRKLLITRPETGQVIARINVGQYVSSLQWCSGDRFIAFSAGGLCGGVYNADGTPACTDL